MQKSLIFFVVLIALIVGITFGVIWGLFNHLVPSKLHSTSHLSLQELRVEQRRRLNILILKILDAKLAQVYLLPKLIIHLELTLQVAKHI